MSKVTRPGSYRITDADGNEVLLTALKSEIKPSTPASFHNFQAPKVVIGLRLTISTSFGDSWIAGTHTQNRAKIDERRNTNALNIRHCIIPTKRAHKPDQTDQPRPGTDQSDIRTHQAETQTKAVARGGHRGSFDPTWQRLKLSFGRNVVLILQKAVVNVPISVEGENRPLEL